MIKKIDRVFVFVTDAERAVRFYSEVIGLARVEGFEGDIVFDAGGIRIMLVPGRERGSSMTGADICLWSDDIRGDYGKMVVAGVRFFKPPSRENWGGWLAGFYDSEGNRIYMIQY